MVDEAGVIKTARHRPRVARRCRPLRRRDEYRRAERRRVEQKRLARSVDPQLRLDARHRDSLWSSRAARYGRRCLTGHHRYGVTIGRAEASGVLRTPFTGCLDSAASAMSSDSHGSRLPRPRLVAGDPNHAYPEARLSVCSHDRV